MDTIVARVDNIDATAGVDIDCPGLVQLPRCAPWSPPGRDRFAVPLPALHAVSAEFADEDPVLGDQLHTVGVHQLAGLGSFAAEDRDRLGFFLSPVHHLDPMVACVRDPEQAIVVDGECLWPTELQGSISMFAESIDVLTVGGVFVDAIKLPIFGQIECPVRRADDVGDPAKLPGLRTIHATDGLICQKLAIGTVGQESKVMGIGYEQVACRKIDRSAGRFPVGSFGSLPSSEEFASEAENLNPGRFVDDVDFIGRADGQDSRFLKASVGEASLADHQIGGGEVARAIGYASAEESGGGQRKSVPASDGGGAGRWTDMGMHYQT